jgi:hypothetical protein
MVGAPRNAICLPARRGGHWSGREVDS